MGSPHPTHLQGSSPHTRGAPVRGDDAPQKRGIIPAYAGSTPAGLRPAAAGKDHPRIRGEHEWEASEVAFWPGSSPHTRGAHRSMDGQTRGRRIIPAYAGSTSETTTSESTITDHPRIRGEHLDPRQRASRGPGSSPHTRGAPDRRQAGQPRDGIIPAYAGSTVLRFPLRPGGLGSSPHTRGALCSRG